MYKLFSKSRDWLLYVKKKNQFCGGDVVEVGLRGSTWNSQVD